MTVSFGIKDGKVAAFLTQDTDNDGLLLTMLAAMINEKGLTRIQHALAEEGLVIEWSKPEQ